MMFNGPVPLNRALESQVAKTILPTGLRSRMLATLPAAIRQRSFFSAGVMNADVLQKIDTGIEEILKGGHTEETTRSLLQRLPQILGDEELALESRLRLIVETNVDLARGFGNWQQSQDIDILDEYPAWEFYRAEERKEPRDWPERWEAAGGEFFPGDADYPEGKMIALKTDPIWEQISAFGQPYAPFDYNSGMDVRDIDRNEAEDLGLLEAGDEVHPQRQGFNEGLESHPDAAGAILEALGGFTSGLGIGELAGNLLKFTGVGQ